jgi:hypothetical protein
MPGIAPRSRDAGDNRSLNWERVAYWYFRLNGFFQFENFVVHPSTKGSQRTEADLIGVRFPHRKEFLLDHHDPMQDDADRLRLATDCVDVVIVEIKKNEHCSLNGPWTCEYARTFASAASAFGIVSRRCRSGP